MRQRYFRSLLAIAAMLLPSASGAADIDFTNKTPEELVAYLLFGFEKGVPLPAKKFDREFVITSELQSEKPFKLRLAIPAAGMPDIGSIEIQQISDCEYTAIAELTLRQTLRINDVFNFSKVENPEIVMSIGDNAIMTFPLVGLTCMQPEQGLFCQSYKESGTFPRIFVDKDQIEAVRMNFQKGFGYFKDNICKTSG